MINDDIKSMTEDETDQVVDQSSKNKVDNRYVFYCILLV